MTTNKLFDKVSSHTINKFKLIATYTRDWAYKLLNFPEGEGIIFIDCMCNAGKYIDSDSGEYIDGTAILVAKELLIAANKYSNKKVRLFFNDYNNDKIEHLKKELSSLLQSAPENFSIHFSCCEASEYLKKFTNGKIVNNNTLLIYDPYTIDIDWKALDLFLNTWGEVIINHMVSDIIRGRSQATKTDVIERYENAYLTDFNKLLNIPKNEFQTIVEKIIRSKSRKHVYISTVPFYIKTNVQIYNLIHISHSHVGFRLFKKTAWKLAGGQSAIKEKSKVMSLKLNLEDENCEICEHNYTMADMVNHIITVFSKRKSVPLQEIYSYLDDHPIFVADGFRKEIRYYLTKIYDCTIYENIVTFNGGK